MKRSRAVAELEAAVVLVAITISLASVVYGGIRSYHVSRQEVFVNDFSLLAGSPRLAIVRVNSSSEATLLSFQADSALSGRGILGFGGGGYSLSQSLCAAASITFFSVYAPVAGELQVASNGASWVDGRWVGSTEVSKGWHEVMFSGASTCTVTLPGGQAVAYPGGYVSSVPLSGPRNSTAFEVSLPCDSSPHAFLLFFDGGIDRVEA